MFRVTQVSLHHGKEYMVKYLVADKDDEIKVKVEKEFLYRHHLTECDLSEIERICVKFKRSSFLINDQIIVRDWCSLTRQFIGVKRSTTFLGENIHSKIRVALNDPDKKVIVFVETL